MLLLLIALAGLMAVIFFGLSVLLISVVGWLWPPNGKVGLHVESRPGRKLKNKRPLGV
jgi:hypothetical protein